MLCHVAKSHGGTGAPPSPSAGTEAGRTTAHIRAVIDAGVPARGEVVFDERCDRAMLQLLQCGALAVHTAIVAVARELELSSAGPHASPAHALATAIDVAVRAGGEPPHAIATPTLVAATAPLVQPLADFAAAATAQRMLLQRLAATEALAASLKAASAATSRAPGAAAVATASSIALPNAAALLTLVDGSVSPLLCALASLTASYALHARCAPMARFLVARYDAAAAGGACEAAAAAMLAASKPASGVTGKRGLEWVPVAPTPLHSMAADGSAAELAGAVAAAVAVVPVLAHIADVVRRAPADLAGADDDAGATLTKGECIGRAKMAAAWAATVERQLALQGRDERCGALALLRHSLALLRGAMVKPEASGDAVLRAAACGAASAPAGKLGAHERVATAAGAAVGAGL